MAVGKEFSDPDIDPLTQNGDIPVFNKSTSMEEVESSISHWLRGTFLGCGAFGSVNLALDQRTGNLFAVKSVNSTASPQSLEALEHELHLLKGIDSPHVVKCLGADWSTEDGVHMRNLFLEHAPGGSLADVITQFGGHLDERVVRRYTRGLLQGLCHLHERSVIHCDVKGRNILLGYNGEVKLCDFGAAFFITESADSYPVGQDVTGHVGNVGLQRGDPEDSDDLHPSGNEADLPEASDHEGAFQFQLPALVHHHVPSLMRRLRLGDPAPPGAGGSSLRSPTGGHSRQQSASRATSKLRGTICWMAPEMVQSGAATPAADIWSVGCTVIEMMTGRNPWGGTITDAFSAMYRIGCTEEVPPCPENLSPEGCDFLYQCLKRDPEQRWSAEALLRHPFVTNPEYQPTAASCRLELDSCQPVTLTPVHCETKLDAGLSNSSSSPTSVLDLESPPDTPATPPHVEPVLLPSPPPSSPPAGVRLVLSDGLSDSVIYFPGDSDDAPKTLSLSRDPPPLSAPPLASSTPSPPPPPAKAPTSNLPDPATLAATHRSISSPLPSPCTDSDIDFPAPEPAPHHNSLVHFRPSLRNSTSARRRRVTWEIPTVLIPTDDHLLSGPPPSSPSKSVLSTPVFPPGGEGGGGVGLGSGLSRLAPIGDSTGGDGRGYWDTCAPNGTPAPPQWLVVRSPTRSPTRPNGGSRRTSSVQFGCTANGDPICFTPRCGSVDDIQYDVGKPVGASIFGSQGSGLGGLDHCLGDSPSGRGDKPEFGLLVGRRKLGGAGLKESPTEVEERVSICPEYVDVESEGLRGMVLRGKELVGGVATSQNEEPLRCWPAAPLHHDLSLKPFAMEEFPITES